MKYVYGAGNGGHLWADIAEEAGIAIDGFVDDFDPKYLKPDILLPQDEVVVAIYNNVRRLELVGQYNALTVVHPAAYIFKSAQIGNGVLVKPLVMVGARTVVEDGAILDSGVLVEHDSRICRGAYVSVGSRLGSSVEIGERTLVGINCTIQSGVKIGRDCTINSGAIVYTDVPDGKTVKPRM